MDVDAATEGAAPALAANGETATEAAGAPQKMVISTGRTPLKKRKGMKVRGRTRGGSKLADAWKSGTASSFHRKGKTKQKKVWSG